MLCNTAAMKWLLFLFSLSLSFCLSLVLERMKKKRIFNIYSFCFYWIFRLFSYIYIYIYLARGRTYKVEGEKKKNTLKENGWGYVCRTYSNQSDSYAHTHTRVLDINGYWALSTSDVHMCRLFVSAGQWSTNEKRKLRIITSILLLQKERNLTDRFEILINVNKDIVSFLFHVLYFLIRARRCFFQCAPFVSKVINVIMNI